MGLRGQRDLGFVVWGLGCIFFAEVLRFKEVLGLGFKETQGLGLRV